MLCQSELIPSWWNSKSPSSQWDESSKCQLRWQLDGCKLTPDFWFQWPHFLFLLIKEVAKYLIKGSLNVFFFLIFLKKFTKSQDGDYLASLFPAPTAVYLSTELLGQENGSPNGGLARTLSGSGPQSAVFWAVCNVLCPVWQPKTDGF